MNKTQDIFFEQFKKACTPPVVLAGIDYGMRRIGVALSSADWETTTPFKTIHQLHELDDIIPAKNIGGLVVGWPLQPDGTEGKMTHQVRLFVDRLVEKYGLPVMLVDERLTSYDAESAMQDIGLRQKKITAQLDAAAARRILDTGIKMLKGTP